MAQKSIQQIKQEVNSSEKLHDKIGAWQKYNTKLTKMGYTADKYKEVFDALKKDKEVITRVVNDYRNGTMGGPNGQMIANDYSTMIAINWAGGEKLVDGFLTTNDGTTLYQGLVEANTYMSFIASGVFDNKSLIVDVDRGITGEDKPLGGVSPGNNLMNNLDSQVQSTKTGAEKNYRVGVGISFNFVSLFFEKCFNYKKDSAFWRELGQKKQIFAEVSVSKVSGSRFQKNQQGQQVSQQTEANVFHAMVIHDMNNDNTANDENSQTGSLPKIWLPIPLLLLSDYIGLGLVKLNVQSSDGNTNSKTVGIGSVSFPLSGEKYNHKTGEINMFSPSYVKEVVSKDGGLKGADSDIHAKQARVRLYLDPSLKGTKDFPDNNEMFTGAHNVTLQTVQMGMYSSGAIPSEAYIFIDVGHVEGKSEENKLNKLIANSIHASFAKKGVRSSVMDFPKTKVTYGADLDDTEHEYIRNNFAKNPTQSAKIALFLSIHMDSNDSSQRRGGHIIYNNTQLQSYGVINKELADNLQGRFVDFFKNNTRKNTDMRDDLTVLGGYSNKVKLPAMDMPYPAILCECGFYTNGQDKALITNANTRDKLANEICDGVIAILSKHNRLPRM